MPKAMTIAEIGDMLRNAATDEKLIESEARRLLALGGLMIGEIPLHWTRESLDVESWHERLEQIFPSREQAIEQLRGALLAIEKGARMQGAHTGMSWSQVEEIAQKALRGQHA